MTGMQTAAEQKEVMVEVRGLTKSYGSVLALDTVDLVVNRGEFVTLLGPSGSGKTTLLNLVAGMVKPTAGTVIIDGQNVTASPPSQRRLGMVFQNYALMPHMNVFDNIAFPLRVRRVAKDEIRQRVHDALKLVRLPDIAARKPRELSGGQQQRVSLARCIVYNPALILLDEPLGALDKKLREQMQLEIRRIHSDLGMTMINVTHDQHEALTMSDRIVLMNHGRIEQQGGPEELYFRPKSVFAADFLGNANLIPATVEGTEQGAVRLATAFGPITAPRPSFELSAGQQVRVLIRPENMRLADDTGPVDGTFGTATGKLNEAIVLGSTVRHLVQVGDLEVMTEDQNRRGRPILRRGAPVTLCWDPEDALIILTDGPPS
jgi:putative spermidine/putrescine transport system ATP-binding protein